MQRKITEDDCTFLHCQDRVCVPLSFSLSLTLSIAHKHARECTHTGGRRAGTSRIKKLAAAYDFHHKVSTALFFDFGVHLHHVLVRQLCHRFNLGQHGKKGAQRARACMGDQQRVQTRDGTPAYAADFRVSSGGGGGSDTGCTQHDCRVASAPPRQGQLCTRGAASADAVGRGGAAWGTS